MPDVTDPIIITHDNTKARPLADAVVSAYDTLKHYRIEWTRLTGLTTVSNTTDQIADGSQTSKGAAADGRGPMSTQLLTGLDALAALLITALETNATLGGVTKARVEFLRDVAVNGAPKY